MKKLTFEELEMVTGGDEAAADAYLRELHKKYGGRNILMVLARATDEEVNHYGIPKIDCIRLASLQDRFLHINCLFRPRHRRTSRKVGPEAEGLNRS